jgi:hypothetical protein
MPKPTIPDDLQLDDVDDLPYAVIFAIKAATGVDVTDMAMEAGPALVWYALKQRDPATTWNEVKMLRPKDVGHLFRQLTERLTREAQDAAVQRARNDDAAAIQEQSELMGDDPVEVPEPVTDPTSGPVSSLPS